MTKPTNCLFFKHCIFLFDYQKVIELIHRLFTSFGKEIVYSGEGSDFIRARVARLETDGNADLCKITEAHFFRGRFSFKSVQAMKDPVK